ncbi:MAG: low specificity L-threonine aldolase [Lachnospiraceae bacterium]|nr:low specificity L-threonine aldolase [Lachnospiraceae bacterium]
MTKLYFASDYQEGAHPEIMKRLMETNLEHTEGYGTDAYSNQARAAIRSACKAKDAMVYFLGGGTQTNATVIASMLASYEGAIAADTGHINVHEAGAVEYTGHRVLALPSKEGKLAATTIDTFVAGFLKDDSWDHMVYPGMVYLSQPTEYGTIYSKAELEQIREVCLKYNMKLYIDGARLAYALEADGNDVTLEDLAKLCDAFYIGGTKCGALFGEAVVVPDPKAIPHFFTMIKQHGALTAKGRILGIQFGCLFTDGLYERVGANGVAMANRLRQILQDKGYELYMPNPTNQVFVVMDNDRLARLQERVVCSVWEALDDSHTVIRLATSWATTEADIQALAECL